MERRIYEIHHSSYSVLYDCSFCRLVGCLIVCIQYLLVGGDGMIFIGKALVLHKFMHDKATHAYRRICLFIGILLTSAAVVCGKSKEKII